MPTMENQLIAFVKSALAQGDRAFVDDFVKNGPIPGGVDGASRYLLAVALNTISPERLAEVSGVSVPVATYLKNWLEDGTRA